MNDTTIEDQIPQAATVIVSKRFVKLLIYLATFSIAIINSTVTATVIYFAGFRVATLVGIAQIVVSLSFYWEANRSVKARDAAKAAKLTTTKAD